MRDDCLCSETLQLCPSFLREVAGDAGSVDDSVHCFVRLMACYEILIKFLATVVHGIRTDSDAPESYQQQFQDNFVVKRPALGDWLSLLEKSVKPVATGGPAWMQSPAPAELEEPEPTSASPPVVDDHATESSSIASGEPAVAAESISVQPSVQPESPMGNTAMSELPQPEVVDAEKRVLVERFRMLPKTSLPGWWSQQIEKWRQLLGEYSDDELLSLFDDLRVAAEQSDGKLQFLASLEERLGFHQNAVTLLRELAQKPSSDAHLKSRYGLRFAPVG